MNCPKCNATLADGSVYCTECGDQFAVNAQRAKVQSMFAGTKDTILKSTKNPIFLVVAICFTVMFLSSLATFNILSLIFGLIAVIGLWRSFATKDVANLKSSLRQASIYDAYTRVMYTISIWLISIFGAIGSIVAIVTSLLAGDITATVITALVCILAMALSIVIISLFRSIYKKRRAYFVALSDTTVNGKYAQDKAPVIGSYIVGGATFLGGLVPAIGSIAITGLLNALLGDVEALATLLPAVSTLLITMGVSSLITGLYMILSAVWMAIAHKALVAHKQATLAECARLEALETETKQAIMAAEHEAKKAQADITAQQQQMMQMMMMQMMQQNGMTMPTAAAPVEEAPAEEAAEEAVVEEAPVEEAAEEAVVEEAPVEEAAEEAVVEEAPVEETAE